jgi:hypothetical protein
MRLGFCRLWSSEGLSVGGWGKLGRTTRTSRNNRGDGDIHGGPSDGGGKVQSQIVLLTHEDARRLALSLLDAVEQDHHGRPSFRVSKRIFATLWDEHHMNVMVDEPGILTAVQAHPRVCSEVWWGKRRAAVRVDLRAARPQLLAALLEDAWESKRAG